MILSLAVMIGLIALYFVLSSIQPLTEGSVMTAEEWQRLEDETLVLLQKRDRVFAEIRELDFEAALNKVDLDDFTVLKRRYEDEALDIMDQLQVAFETYGSRIDDDIDAIVEAARLRRKAAVEQSEIPDAVTEIVVATVPDAAATEPDAAATEPDATTENVSVDDSSLDEVSSGKEPSQSKIAMSQIGIGGSVNPAGLNTSMYKCKTCDAFLPRDARFCDHCGAEQLVLCASCGFENRVDARFCRSCGDALESNV